MFRILLSFILTAFLFIGIITTANYFIQTDRQTTRQILVQPSSIELERLTIKQIDNITADNNLYFTSKNSLR